MRKRKEIIEIVLKIRPVAAGLTGREKLTEVKKLVGMVEIGGERIHKPPHYAPAFLASLALLLAENKLMIKVGVGRGKIVSLDIFLSSEEEWGEFWTNDKD